MQFLSDNSASVHPRVWAAMEQADAADTPYNTDILSRELDGAFSQIFGRECAALWASTGTAANCLALSTIVEPHGGVICHKHAHLEMDEGGAPGFFLHGAKLLVAEGDEAKLTQESVEAVLQGIERGVHQVDAHAISITQLTEFGQAYSPSEILDIGACAKENDIGLHMDGARFANAAASLGGDAAKALGPADMLSFGFTKNGAMNAEAIVFFDPERAEIARLRRKRAGHLLSKGRFLAAQILAQLEGGLWLELAEKANAAASEIASGAGDRLLYQPQGNMLFLRLSDCERQALRKQGFSFYDWGDEGARLVTSWDSQEDHVMALSKAIAAL